ncbi:putative C-type lectin domain family 20 member A [Trichomycterus rosablanca]|uniref:putative C-type lectin domain family 20 member A n=1 Tax=Trichomycterus rosablanca TaxID=2290929 RepID=UPI002F352840
MLLTGFAPVVLSVQSDTTTLYLIKQAMSWPDARSYCKAKYIDLAPVKTYNDLLNIRAEAARQGVTWPIWIGLYDDIDSWRWSYNNLSLSAITLRKWDPFEPNNYNGIEQCGVITSLGGWCDCSCSTLKPFICYNAEYPGDSRFVGIAIPQLNWTDAQTYCRSFHTDLATALDETENNLLQQVASGQGDSWFGLYRDAWFWTDHTKAQNIYWTPGQPDNYYTDENCGEFYGGLLEDMSCTSGNYFFCHYNPIQRNIVKLQVTSDQNVFDAAVQSSLLMKIVQKLEELSMLKNITVTWRVQPDGNIFYKKNDDV